MSILFFIVLFVPLFIFSLSTQVAAASDRISRGQLMRDGETIISAGKVFVLGFFSPERSSSIYLGTWYYNMSEQMVVWVANRNNPISGGGGTLRIGEDGNLEVLDGNANLVWFTNVSFASTNLTSAILLDNGNFVLTHTKAALNDSSESIGDALWESFNDPADTFLPGMIVNVSNITGESQFFRSWRSVNDPSPGSYLMGIDNRVSPQLVVWDENSKRKWRSGYWNGQVFIGDFSMSARLPYGFTLRVGGDGSYYITYVVANISHLVNIRIRWDGVAEQKLSVRGKDFALLESHPSNQCEMYNRCGDFAKCSRMDEPICTCISGFKPKDEYEWQDLQIWSGGCVRKEPLNCNNNSSSAGERFVEMERIKLPDYADSWVAVDNRTGCEKTCLNNCSCTAYTYTQGIGCMIWSGPLVDLEQLPVGGVTLYIRLSISEFNDEIAGRRKKSSIKIIAVVIGGAILFTSISILIIRKYMSKVKGTSCIGKILSVFFTSTSTEAAEFTGTDIATEGQGSNELPSFNFSTLVIATENFADQNKLGQGGFGPVYKGTLPGRQEIAVKRLSRRSGQGLEELKNEIVLIAKLQHRNLVRLLGCCIEGEEKMLIYEYMPNKSLDSFILGTLDKRAALDWNRRFNIIKGIARGIIYLHRDSRLKIIHRDLKAGNVLLDENLNPKISDFGMARIFGGDQDKASTNRIVGTYGYMSPEYAMEGLYSEKSDVYSFGVLLLEIVSGTSVRSSDSSLVRHAWNLWNDGKCMKLVDPSVIDSSSQTEVVRCINVGLLCVQDSPDSRPTMSAALLMLESENASLPLPGKPNSVLTKNFSTGNLGIEWRDDYCSNGLSVTNIVGR